jgi:oxalate decarboxylase
VTIFGNTGEHSTFTITEGQMFFVPSGYIHHIENINLSNDTSPAEFILAFSHELPEDFQLSSAVAAMYETFKFIEYNEIFLFICRTDAVLGNTFQLPASAWKGIVKRGEETVIGQKDTVTVSINDKRMYGFPSKFKFDVEKMSPAISVPEGWAKMAIKQAWPVLDKSKLEYIN